MGGLLLSCGFVSWHYVYYVVLVSAALLRPCDSSRPAEEGGDESKSSPSDNNASNSIPEGIYGDPI